MTTKEEPFYTSYSPIIVDALPLAILMCIPLIFIEVYLSIAFFIIALFVSCYVLFFFFIRGVKFYSDHFEIIFPLRFRPLFKERNIIIPYFDIEEVRLKDPTIGPDPAKVEVKLKKYIKYKFLKKIFYSIAFYATVDIKYFLKKIKEIGLKVEIEASEDYKKEIQP